MIRIYSPIDWEDINAAVSAAAALMGAAHEGRIEADLQGESLVFEIKTGSATD